LLALIQGWLFYKLLSAAFRRTKPHIAKPLFIVLSLCFVTLLCAFRGYEIRVEALPNTCLMITLYWLSIEQGIKKKQRYMASLFGISLILVLAVSLSLRHALPAAFLCLAAISRFVDRQGYSLSTLWWSLAIMSASLVLFVGVNFCLSDLQENLIRASQHQSHQEAMDFGTRFTINTWPGYSLFTVLCLGSLGILWFYTVLAIKIERSQQLVNGLLLCALSSFYFFLWRWDVSPRAYIHSIEWILILGTLLNILRTIASRNGRILTLCLVLQIFVTLCLIFLSFKATENLYVMRNTTAMLNGVTAVTGSEEMEKLDEAALVNKLLSLNSLRDQINARIEFCRRYKGSSVISGSILYHPICLADRGTYNFSGWGSEPVDLLGLPPEESLILLEAPQSQLDLLRLHYGDRFISLPGMARIQKVAH
jgi:hypothetical protein